MTTMNISLPEPLKEFIEEQVSAGGYGTVSEYLRELIRANQKQRAQEKLEQLLLEGINSGPATPMTKQDWIDIRAEVHKRIAGRANKNKR